MKKKFSLIVVMILIVVITFFVCLEQSVLAQGQNILEKVIENKKVKVGILTDYAPYGYRNAKGEYEGFDVEMAYELGKAMAIDVELVSIEAPARIPSLISGKVDVLIACLRSTEERAKMVNFTIPYASGGLRLMVRDDNEDVKSYKDLSGKTVATVRGSTNEIAIAELAPDAELVKFDSIADAFMAFKSKKTEVLIDGYTAIHFHVKENPGFKAVGDMIAGGLISFAIVKNDQEWLNYLNTFLTNLRYSGKVAMIYEKWFGFEQPSLVLN